MTALEQLNLVLNEKYVSEDGDEYKIELKPGLTDQQVDKLATDLPAGQIPSGIRELLKFASGFEFFGLESITFDGVGQFGFENIFPYSVQLAGDGYGNFWILDVDNKGNWNSVFFVCHDPAVVVKHSDSLTEFIGHIDEFGKKGKESNLDIIHESSVMDIWSKYNGFIDIETARKSGDKTLNEFASGLPDNFVIADLRNQPNKAGFAWGKFGPNIDKAVRYETELLWGFEKQVKKGFLSKLLGR